jgi:hypothetical protein
VTSREQLMINEERREEIVRLRAENERLRKLESIVRDYLDELTNANVNIEMRRMHRLLMRKALASEEKP